MKELLHNEVIVALCWTLLHSLWQGLLFAIIAATVRLSSKNADPNVRYNCFAFLLWALLITCLLTFLYEWTILQANEGQSTWDIANRARVIQRRFTFRVFSDNLHQLDISALISAYAGWIITTWFAMLLFKTVKMTIALGYTGHVRKRKSAEVGEQWENKLKALCVQLAIKRPVALVESAVIRVPVVYGHLKPVILFPLGIFSQLPADQIEAILLHELAHIRRNDYLVNLFQKVAEIFFFFNPAVLWLSSLIREEREHCCDDIAIRQMGNRKLYVETLISFWENRIYRAGQHGTAVPGFKGILPARVRRIVTSQNASLSLPEKSFLIGCSLVVIVLFAITGKMQRPLKLRKEVAIDNITGIQFPLGKVIRDISNDLVEAGAISNKNSFSFELTNSSLLVDGRKQPDALWKKLNTKYLLASPYPIRPEHRKDPGFGIFFNTRTHVNGIGTRPPAWGT